MTADRDRDKTRIALLQLLEDEAEAAAEAALANPRLLRRGAELAAAARRLVAPPPAAKASTFAAGTAPARERDRVIRGARLHAIRHLETLSVRVGENIVPPRDELMTMPDEQLRATIERVENLARNATKTTR